ncbi:MAG: integrase [Desulfobacterales bacterium]|nr:integrase [Desulfobacterales bacterium]
MDEQDMSTLPLDDQFMFLLHKKIMNKKGSAKRRAKKYYKDQYKKTGIIPKPLLLAGQGIMEGRKCSGRPRVITCDEKKRFVDMVKASCDANDPGFIYITQKARVITNYHKFLEEEFQKKISIHALRRLVREENLDLYLKQPDFDKTQMNRGYFNPEKIFDLIQVDGCKFQYIKIKDENGKWCKPQVIEFYDTGSRYMFVLEFYFSETSQNAVDLFTRFLLDGPLPKKRIRLRPDRAKGFLNLKRPIHELNIKYSMPDGFYMDPDFSGARSPKHKVHLESSHRSLHNFEIRIIKKFENRIAKIEPGFTFKGNKKEQITVTCLNITIRELRESRMIELYRREHNDAPHRFSERGKTQTWVPSQKLQKYLSEQETLEFDPTDMDAFMRYGFDKKKATVSRDKTIISNKQKYTVVVGTEKFSAYKSTTVKVSHYNNKLYIFDYKDDGICLGEALCQGPSDKPEAVTKKADKRLKQNEVEQIAGYLENKEMSVDMNSLISCYHNGLTFNIAKAVFEKNIARYDQLGSKLLDPKKVGFVRFNAFLIDYRRYHQKEFALPGAKGGEHG